MHLVECLVLPDPYVARAYRGSEDHAAMARVLGAYRALSGNPEMPTVEQMDVTYAHLEGCDPATDIVVVETADGEVIGYARPSWEDLEDGTRDCVSFTPVVPEHVGEALFLALLGGQERHMLGWAGSAERGRYRAYARHPGPGLEPEGEAAWLERSGYVATEWEASLVRPHLDDIPERPLPNGVVVRPVTDDQLRTIWEAHSEAFRGEWDFRRETDEDYQVFLEEPLRDESLWKIAWVGEAVVGQVKSYINPEENAARGYQRGYTEFISTHAEWRNRGIAGALLAMSLRELRDRGMTEAALGVDTNNPGGAFHLYTGLGFELQSYEAVYTKGPVSSGTGKDSQRPWSAS